MTPTNGSNDPRPQSPPPKGKGCLKNLAVGCLGMILGSVFVIGIEIAGAASLIGTLSTALLGAAGSSGSSGYSGSGNDGSDGVSSPHGETEADRLWEWRHRKEQEEQEAKEQAEKDAQRAEDDAKREQELNRIHDKLAEPSW